MDRICVLIVDDERNIISSMRRLLRGASEEFSFHFALGGGEALELLKGGAPVDVLVSDFRMPEMDGYSLAREVRKRYPATKVVILSGEEKSNDETGGSIDRWLSKPCEIDSLLSTIREIAG